MMATPKHHRHREIQMNSNEKRCAPVTLATLLLAGLAGGIAEAVWVAIYSTFAPLGSSEVLRQIVATASPALAASSAAPALGMLMHLSLAIVLAICYGRLVWGPIQHRSGLFTSMLAGVAALALVWALNFFVLLPVLNPAFVLLLPYSASLISKLLFGAAMGSVLFARNRNFAGRYRPRRTALTLRALQSL
jgi:hypothetical protein